MNIHFIPNKQRRNPTICILSINSIKIDLAMKNQIYKYTGGTLSMFMTFIIHCALRDTRASGSFFQNMVADPMYNYAMTVRCWFYYSFCKYS